MKKLVIIVALFLLTACASTPIVPIPVSPAPDPFVKVLAEIKDEILADPSRVETDLNGWEKIYGMTLITKKGDLVNVYFFKNFKGVERIDISIKTSEWEGGVKKRSTTKTFFVDMTGKFNSLSGETISTEAFTIQQYPQVTPEDKKEVRKLLEIYLCLLNEGEDCE